MKASQVKKLAWLAKFSLLGMVLGLTQMPWQASPWNNDLHVVAYTSPAPMNHRGEQSQKSLLPRPTILGLPEWKPVSVKLQDTHSWPFAGSGAPASLQPPEHRP